MKLYNWIEKRKRNKRMSKSSEYSFFLKNRHLLEKHPRFTSFYNVDNEFMMMRANILIHGIINKKTIENELENIVRIDERIDKTKIRSSMAELLLDCPNFKDGERKILIPFFSKALNDIYVLESDKLEKEPYKKLKKEYEALIVDAFETYGYELYNSTFTKLIFVKNDKTSAAFYHIDYQTIYFVNNQGRLDARLVLFDKDLHHPNTSHIFERIVPVVDAYFSNDKIKFLNSLYENELISLKLRNKLSKKDYLRNIKQAKRIKK